MLTSALIAFDSLGLAVVAVCLATALCAAWSALGSRGLAGFLGLVAMFVLTAALVAGANNLILWLLAWELATFVGWGMGRWMGRGAQTMLGPLPLQGFGALGSLAMAIAVLSLALSNGSIAIHGLVASDSRAFLVFLLVAVLLKSFALLSPAWYASGDGRGFFVAQAVVGGGGLLVVGAYPYLRFLVDNMGDQSAWRVPAFEVALALALLSGLAALGERDLPQAAACLVFSQFAGLLARFAQAQPGDVPLVLANLVSYALAIVALNLCLAGAAGATGQRDLTLIGGQLGRRPFAGATFLLAGLSLAGLPPLVGFAALATTAATQQAGGNATEVYLLYGLSALTLCVVLRLYHAVFGVAPAAKQTAARATPLPLMAVAAAIVLALLFAGILPDKMLALLHAAGAAAP